MTLAHLCQLIVVAFTVAIGQVLFKYGAAMGPPGDSVLGVVRLFLQPVIILALVLYALSVGVWVVTLQHVPLTMAYPFMALGFVLTPLAAALVFKESLDLRYFMGMALILIGIYLASAPR